MSTCYVYQIKNKQIISILLGDPDDEGTSKITVLDSNIPPSEAKCIGTFKADAQYDYINNMIPILLEHLHENKQLMKKLAEIDEEGI